MDKNVLIILCVYLTQADQFTGLFWSLNNFKNLKNELLYTGFIFENLEEIWWFLFTLLINSLQNSKKSIFCS